jgi:nucleolar protein 15
MQLTMAVATEDAAPLVVKKPKTPKLSGEGASNSAKEIGSQKPLEKANGEPTKKKEAKAAKKNTNGIKESVAAVKKTKELKLPKPIDEEEDDGAMADEEYETSDVDDQTEALLKGFESDNDEEEDKKEGGLGEGQDVPLIPTLSNKSKKALLRAQNEKYLDKPGVVYIGRIPHGFYENEMREYFKQF